MKTEQMVSAVSRELGDYPMDDDFRAAVVAALAANPDANVVWVADFVRNAWVDSACGDLDAYNEVAL